MLTGADATVLQPPATCTSRARPRPAMTPYQRPAGVPMVTYIRAKRAVPVRACHSHPPRSEMYPRVAGTRARGASYVRLDLDALGTCARAGDPARCRRARASTTFLQEDENEDLKLTLQASSIKRDDTFLIADGHQIRMVGRWQAPGATVQRSTFNVQT